MGCLRNIIKFIIFTLAIIGFVSIGGKEFLENNVTPVVSKFNTEFQAQLDKNNKNISQLTFEEFCQIFGNSFSKTVFNTKVSGEYEITELKGLMGYDTLIAQDIKSGQKMVTVNTGDKLLLDLTNENKTEMKVNMLNLAKKHKALPMSFDDIDIIETGKWKVTGKQLAYAKVKIKDKHTGKDIVAIISSLPQDNDNKMLITFGDEATFDKKIAEKYFKKK